MLRTLSIAFLLLCSTALGADLLGRSQDQAVRVIPYQEKAIQDQLRPDDQIVVISREVDAQQIESAPTTQELLRHIVYIADVIAIVEVNDVSGVLVDGGTWINTRVASTAKNVLKDQNRPLRVGSTLWFQFSGGKMTIGKVVVKAWDVPTTTVGRSYLMFLKVEPTDGRLYPVSVPYLIDGDVLKADLPFPTAAGEGPNPLNGYPLQKLIADVRRLAKQ
jgi:hypothetical protein